MSPRPPECPPLAKPSAPIMRSAATAVPVDRILLTASTSEAYAYLFKLLTNPGDEILVPRPSYPLFQFLADMESVTVRQYSLAYHGGWSIDLHSVEQALSPRTRAIVLVNPNNPTGSYVKRGELAGLTAFCARAGYRADLRRSLRRLQPLRRCRPCDHAGRRRRMPGVLHERPFQGGRIAADEARLDGGQWSRATAREGVRETWSGWRTLISRSARRCSAPPRACWPRARRCSVRFGNARAANLAFARAALAGSAANILNVEGGWYITLQVPQIHSEEEWALQLLERADVLVQPGYFYDFETEAYLVVSLLTAPEIFREGLARLVQQLK